jgi:urease accessory protein
MQYRRARHACLFLFALGAWLALYGLAASPAWAHFSGSTGGGWAQGFFHPLTGLDHLVAAVGVGVWAAQLGPRAPLIAPLSFLLAMLLGAALGFIGGPLAAADDAIAVSIAVLCVLLAVAAQPRLVPSMLLVGVFGLAHGYAHGAEVPQDASPLLYTMGFLTATGLLQLVGLGLGRNCAKLPGSARAAARHGGNRWHGRPVHNGLVSGRAPI